MKLPFSFFGRQTGQRGMVGIEVRPTSLSIAVLVKEKVKLLDFVEAMPAKRLEALSGLVREHKLEGMSCNLVLPPDLYSVQQVDRPAVEDNELVEAVRWKIKDRLEFNVDDAVIDVYGYPADALRGRPPQVNVVAARKAVIVELIHVVNGSGLQLQSIDITELALRNLVLPVTEEGHAVALMVMRESSGIMLLIKDSTVYFSRRLDADMQGLSDPAQQDRIGQQLALEVQRSMDYFESQMRQNAPRSLFAAAEINEAEIFAHLDDVLGVAVLALPEDRIGIADDQFAGARHWVACGGAMRKSGSAKPGADL